MDPNKALHGVVIRRDGTVPFDADYPEAAKEATLAWLKKHYPDHEVHTDSAGKVTHAKIANWTPPNS